MSQKPPADREEELAISHARPYTAPGRQPSTTGKERGASRGQGDNSYGAEGQDGSGDDFYLVEALSRRHYEMSHLPGAIYLPYEFVDEAGKVLPDKGAEIVIYCVNEECEASREEARELQEMGYRHVLHYAGGKEGWIKAGLPVESGRRRA